MRMKRAVFANLSIFYLVKAEQLKNCPRARPYAINDGKKCTAVFQIIQDELTYPDQYRKGSYVVHLR